MNPHVMRLDGSMDLLFQIRVEVAGGLIKHEYLRIGQKRAS